jgi:hypothetical protein
MVDAIRYMLVRGSRQPSIPSLAWHRSTNPLRSCRAYRLVVASILWVCASRQKGLSAVHQLDICSAYAGNLHWVLDDVLSNVGTIAHGALDTVKVVLYGSAENNGKFHCQFIIWAECCHPVVTNPHGLSKLNFVHLVWHRHAEPSQE